MDAIIFPGLRDARIELMAADVSSADSSGIVTRAAALESQIVAVEADALARTLALADPKQRSKAAKVFELLSGMFAKGDWKNRP